MERSLIKYKDRNLKEIDMLQKNIYDAQKAQ